MTRESQKTLYLVAGPNGAGKSTFTQQKNIEAPVVDPDAIAREMNPGDPRQASVAAGRQAVKAIREHIRAGRSFAREMTLSGNSGLKLINQVKKAGYRVELHYIGVNNWMLSRERGDERVQQGGHDIPTGDLKRRFKRSLDNLKGIIKRVDAGKLYDNTGFGRQVVADIDKGQVYAIAGKNLPHWISDAGVWVSGLTRDQKDQAGSRGRGTNPEKPGCPGAG